MIVIISNIYLLNTILVRKLIRKKINGNIFNYSSLFRVEMNKIQKNMFNLASLSINII